jgi:putative copper export protein
VSGVVLEAAAKPVQYAALLTALGAGAAHWLLLPRVRRLVDAAVVDDLERSLRRIGLGASIVMLLALVLRAWTHSVEVSGLADSWRWESIRLVTVESRWGRSWQIQSLGACVWVVTYASARVGRSTGWLLATLAGIACCFTLPLSGHAAGVPSRMLVHGSHVLGAGVWLGTLAALLASRVTVGRGTLLRSFAPLALSGAALVALTGSTAAWLYVGAIDQLWTTTYGRVLSLKVGLVVGVAVCGYANWRRLHATPLQAARERVLRLEILFAILVVLVTAVLTELEHP